MIERRKFVRGKDKAVMRERRRYIRVMENGAIALAKQGKGPSGNGTILDLSIRGLRVASGLSLKRGDKVQTEFKLGKDMDLSMMAVVRHSYPWKSGQTIYGVEFFIRDLSDLREHMKLNQFIMTERARQDEVLRRHIEKEKK